MDSSVGIVARRFAEPVLIGPEDGFFSRERFASRAQTDSHHKERKKES